MTNISKFDSGKKYKFWSRQIWCICANIGPELFRAFIGSKFGFWDKCFFVTLLTPETFAVSAATLKQFGFFLFRFFNEQMQHGFDSLGRPDFWSDMHRDNYLIQASNTDSENGET